MSFANQHFGQLGFGGAILGTDILSNQLEIMGYKEIKPMPQCHWIIKPIPGTNKGQAVAVIFDDN